MGAGDIDAVMRMVLIAFAAVLILGAMIVGHARGQDGHHHPLHADYYRHWMQPGITPAVSCCNARRTQQGVEIGDCEPTEARVVNGHWQAWLRQESRWVDIPDGKLIRERNPTGQEAHLCWSAGRVLCFVPPDVGG